MRKHSARKWLHFILDLLPVIILPVFALYEINHDHNEPISVDVEQNEVVNFNQLRQDERNLYDNYGISIVFDNQAIVVNGNTDRTLGVGFFTPILNNVYLVRNNISNTQFRAWCVDRYINGDVIVTASNTNLWYFTPIVNTLYEDVNYDLQIFNLTQMFGIGNEPTISQFNDWYPHIWYPYNTGTKQLLNIGTETLSNTDIGSQMIYSLYKPVKEYFNFNNVFNFGDIYHWFEVSIFGGTAPMSFFIVWNIVLYQFVMDLVFLIYGLFMWFIDMCEKLMDKPLDSIK